MITLVLMVAHIVGDFFLQTGDTAHRKNASMRLLASHALIYSACMTCASFASFPLGNAWIAALALSLSHFAVDGVKAMATRKKPERDNVVLFVLDQFLHAATILILTRILQPSVMEYAYPMGLLLEYVNYEQVRATFGILLIYLICFQPAAVFIKKLLQKPMGADHTKVSAKSTQESTGRLIGILERFTILTLGLMGQLGAIGLIIAAKSLARFSQLADKDFAERYLVGTLASVLIALVCVYIGSNLA
jgi:hypothetical protein